MLLEDFSVFSLFGSGLTAVLGGGFLAFVPAYVLFLLGSLGREGIQARENGQMHMVSVTVMTFSAFFAVGFLAVSSLHSAALAVDYDKTTVSFLWMDFSTLEFLRLVGCVMLLVWAAWLLKASSMFKPSVLQEGEWPQATVGAVMVALGLSMSLAPNGEEMQKLLTVINAPEVLNQGASLLFFYAFGLAVSMYVVGMVIWRTLRGLCSEMIVTASAGFLAVSALMVVTGFYQTLGAAFNKLLPFVGGLG